RVRDDVEGPPVLLLRHDGQRRQRLELRELLRGVRRPDVEARRGEEPVHLKTFLLANRGAAARAGDGEAECRGERRTAHHSETAQTAQTAETENRSHRPSPR